MQLMCPLCPFAIANLAWSAVHQACLQSALAWQLCSLQCNSVHINVPFNADVVSGRSNGYGDTNSLGRKLLQSGECSSNLLLDNHPWFIMTVHKLSCIVLTDIINLASPRQWGLHLCTAGASCLHKQDSTHIVSAGASVSLVSHVLQLT